MRLRRALDKLGMALFVALAALAVAPLFWLIADVYIKGAAAIAKLGGLWTFLLCPPPTPFDKEGGVGPMLVGTLYMTALGALAGFAVGFPLGVYIGEMGRERLAQIARAGVNILVEFPTVAIGLFVYAVMSLAVDDLNRYLSKLPGGWFLGPLEGFNAYAGAVALAIVMIPYVALATASAYASIERPLREAAYGVGGREFNAVFIVLRKVVSRAVLTAALIGTAKAAGETAPLLFTAFGNAYYSPFTGPTGAVSLWIWYAAQSPYEVQILSAYGAAAVLLTIVLVIFILARVLR